ncbi:J domain-containing protein [Agathobaculum sp.]|uniref:J domain-containing protein n=1 Tax=Agathobaculum sp. TaxID=2048138 RepID=UPI002A8212FF|nr:DnaJ domain-containing protein [Agathobaculum sp.]MDY3618118.1 DnaJ domain-containing protein [Agathobaculum sp.]
MDPYKVLGVTPQTSDDDVKRAYRDLARKYHPDNYINNPLSDLAEQRMKEINEAYDMIMNERAGRTNGSQQQAGGAYGSQQQRQYAGANAGMYSQVRQAINQGNLGLAESLLQRTTARDAEWFFLMGTVYYRKGWYDEAGRAYTQACQMDPSNAEYRGALNSLNMSGGYGGYRPMNEANMCDCCMQMMCLNCCCQSCCGGGC